eukprot:scaffold130_cov124-Skeletonema_dohrnii-CCMP3373.AAC.4
MYLDRFAVRGSGSRFNSRAGFDFNEGLIGLPFPLLGLVGRRTTDARTSSFFRWKNHRPRGTALAEPLDS